MEHSVIEAIDEGIALLQSARALLTRTRTHNQSVAEGGLKGLRMQSLLLQPRS
jgi:hypothetical protein